VHIAYRGEPLDDLRQLGASSDDDVHVDDRPRAQSAHRRAADMLCAHHQLTERGRQPLSDRVERCWPALVVSVSMSNNCMVVFARDAR
jgi:hypothetical protein